LTVAEAGLSLASSSRVVFVKFGNREILFKSGFLTLTELDFAC
jgi:hypothetical protein